MGSKSSVEVVQVMEGIAGDGDGPYNGRELCGEPTPQRPSPRAGNHNKVYSGEDATIRRVRINEVLCCLPFMLSNAPQ